MATTNQTERVKKEKPAKTEKTEKAPKAEKTAKAKATKSAKPRTEKRTEKRTERRTRTSPSVKRLKLLITVVNRSKTEFYTDLLSGYEVNFQTSVLGEGTAHSNTLHLLGLDNAERGVIFSVVREEKCAEILRVLEHKFQTVKKGKGIAFTIPLTSVIGVAIYRFLSNNRTPVKEEK